MPEISGSDPYDDIVELMEDAAELASDHPEAIDRYHTYQMILLDAGVDEVAFPVSTRRLIHQMAAYLPTVFDAMLHVITAASRRSYEEGFNAGVEDALTYPDDDVDQSY